MGKQRLSWFLVKPDVDANDVDSLLDPPDGAVLDRFWIPALSTETESLVVKSTMPTPPKWLGYVRGHIDGDSALPRMLSSMGSALLFVRSEGRLLAIAFGHGRHLLRSEFVVPDFGLRVVVNSVDPLQIKSVDARTFDELTVHTRRGVSRDSSLRAFELDVSRNLLRGMTGRSSEGGLDALLTGATALSLTVDVPIPDLPQFASLLLQAYESTRYKKYFDFIDHTRVETDVAVVEALDAKLVHALERSELTNMHLAIPDSVNWDETDGVEFSFKRKQQPYMADPKISVYRQLRDGQISLKRLKADKVEVRSADGSSRPQGRWRVYDCVVFEEELDGRLFVLSGGDWYGITTSYRDEVETYVRGLPELDIDLPPATLDRDEKDYNAGVASAMDIANLDGKPIGVGGVDRVELCDLLTRDGTYIHVKKRGRSSTLSHLFAQGVASAFLLLNDEAFRAEAHRRVEAADPSFRDIVPATAGAREQISVGYVILSRGQREDMPYGLPFFSLVSLRAAAEQLKGAGVNVAVKEVKEEDGSR